MRTVLLVVALVTASALVRTQWILTLTHVAIGLLIAFLLLKFCLHYWLVRALPKSDYVRRRDAEEATMEAADWIGITGLDEATERELPRYLRRELHEFLDDPDGLKAAQLTYLGVLRDDRGLAHFWKLPERKEFSGPTFAYIERNTDGSWAMGWGTRRPSEALGDA